MRGAAGILLRPAVEERGICETGAFDRSLAAVAEHGRATRLLAVHGKRSRAGDRRVGRAVTIEPHAVAVEQADARLLDHVRGHAPRIK